MIRKHHQKNEMKKFISTHILINFLKFKHLNNYNVRIIYERLFYRFEISIQILKIFNYQKQAQLKIYYK